MNNKVFCVSNNDSGWFPKEFALDPSWQRNTGFRPEEPKKPETPILQETIQAEAAPTKPVKGRPKKETNEKQ